MRMSALFYLPDAASCSGSGFCAKKRLRAARFSAKLVLSEIVESVMRKHVRHFATNSMIFILIGERRAECRLWDSKDDIVALSN